MRWLLPLLALAVLGTIGFLHWRFRERDAAELHQRAVAELESSTPDFVAALRDLDLALPLAIAEGDHDLAREILIRQGNAYMQRGALVEARQTYLRAIGDYGPEAFAILQLGWIALRLGEPDRAFEAAEGLLADDPSHAGALHLRARALFALAEGELADVEDGVDEVLADRPAARGLELAWRAAALDPGEPHRAAALSELEALLADPQLFARTRQSVDYATELLVRAREQFARALERHPLVGAIEGLIDLFLRAGHDELVVDLGLAAMPHEGFGRQEKAVDTLVTALLELGRKADAADTIGRARNPDGEVPSRFLMDWCRLLHELEDWQGLRRAADTTRRRMREPGMGGDALAARLFVGIAFFELGQPERAIAELSEYVAAPGGSPAYPYAIGLAHWTIARAARALGRAQDEFVALERATRHAPDLSGEAWLRLAELQVQRGAPMVQATQSLTHAIGLLPERADELLPLWNAHAERAMLESRRQIDNLKENLRREGRWFPERTRIDWELYALGERYLAEGRSWGAVLCFREFLERHPAFAPALDLLIEAELLRGESRKAVELLVRRVREVGPHPSVLRVVERIAPEDLTPEERLLLMEEDPRNTGVITMARTLREQGRTELARMALEAGEASKLQEEARLLLAELRAERGLWREALAAVARVPPTGEHAGRSLALRVRAARAAGGPRTLDLALEPVLAALEADGELDPAGLEEAARALLLAGRADLALPMLVHLDASAATRGGAVLVLRGLAEAELGRPAASLESLERAEAFRGDGEPALARLARLVRTGELDDAPAEVAEVRRTAFAPSPLADALLLALEERVEEARTIAVAEVAREPEDPRWLALHAACDALLPPGERRPLDRAPGAEETRAFVTAGDPRRALALLLLLEGEETPLWAHAELARLDPEAAGTLWPAWLRARALLGHGDDEAALEALRGLVAEHPGFPWGWTALLALERERLEDPLHPALLDLEMRRGQALGPEVLDRATAALLQASALAQAGQPGAGAAALEAELDLPGASPLLGVQAGRLRLAAGAPGRAVLAWSRALEALGPEASRGYVPEVLAVLEAARFAGELSVAAHRAELEALALDHPRDPAVALARARLEQDAHADDPARGLTRALQVLADFRIATGGEPVGALRYETVEPWFRFLLRSDPVRAEAFARSELLHLPGVPDLWRLHGEGLEAQGRGDDALARYLGLVQLLPDPIALRRAAAILADRGSDLDLVQAAVARLLELQGAGEVDPELSLLQARALVNAGGAARDRGIDVLATLWAARDALAGIDPARLGRFYGTSLLHRADPRDRERAAEVLAEVHPLVEDPVVRDLVLALQHLSSWIPDRPPEPEEGNGDAAEAEPSSE